VKSLCTPSHGKSSHLVRGAKNNMKANPEHATGFFFNQL